MAYISKNAQLSEHGCTNEYVVNECNYILEYDLIKEHIVEKFQSLYSTKLYDNNWLWNIAFPEKNEKLQNINNHSYAPKILKKSRKMDKVKTD